LIAASRLSSALRKDRKRVVRAFSPRSDLASQESQRRTKREILRDGEIGESLVALAAARKRASRGVHGAGSREGARDVEIGDTLGSAFWLRILARQATR
jgi:hypothetical protein